MDPSQAALAPRAAHARAPACGAESFVGSDPPVRAAEVADHVFDEIAAAGELRPAALGRLLALYKANTLESALSLVVLCSRRKALRVFCVWALCASCSNWGHRVFPCPLSGAPLALLVLTVARHRTRRWCRSWLWRAAGRCTSWRARATSHTVSTQCAPLLVWPHWLPERC